MSESYDTARGPSIPERFFGVTTDRETYRYLAYVLVRFPLGIAYFTTFLTGLVLGFVLVPLGVGIPLLAIVLGVADHAALVEAALLRRLLGREVQWAPTDPNELPVWPYLKTAATDGRNYLLLVYFMATFWIGTLSFVLATVLLTLSVVYLVAPLVFWLPGVQYGAVDGTVVELGPSTVTTDHTIVDAFTVTSLPEALVASLFGGVTLIIALHVFRLLGRGLAGLTARLLAPRTAQFDPASSGQ